MRARSSLVSTTSPDRMVCSDQYCQSQVPAMVKTTRKKTPPSKKIQLQARNNTTAVKFRENEALNSSRMGAAQTAIPVLLHPRNELRHASVGKLRCDREIGLQHVIDRLR